jgi:ArsR family transcriptional regulator, arsenate/arsenite/antimonite-responsive transcriptional repressor
MTQISKRRPGNPKQAAACCRPIDALLNPALFKALSDPTRATLVACLAKCGRPCSVGEVAECCSVDISVVSRHLALLARSEVLEASKQGREVYYKVRFGDLSRTLRSLADELDSCCGGGRCGPSCC